MESNQSRVEVRCLPCREGAQLPSRMTEAASGFDLAACLEGPLTLRAGERCAVPTGLMMAIPPGFEGVVRPRSGLALKRGVTVLNAPGTIDSDYRGEVLVLLVNLSSEDLVLQHGDRIAQLVVQQLPPVGFRWASTLDDTARGDGGFGHTGIATTPRPEPA